MLNDHYYYSCSETSTIGAKCGRALALPALPAVPALILMPAAAWIRPISKSVVRAWALTIHVDLRHLWMEKFKLAKLHEFPDCPHQPTDFKFRKQAFRKAMRSCQPSWFKQFNFLHYDEAHDLLFCHRLDDGRAHPEFPTSVEDHIHPFCIKPLTLSLDGWTISLSSSKQLMSPMTSISVMIFIRISTEVVFNPSNTIWLAWTYLSSSVWNPHVSLGLNHLLLIYWQSLS